MSITWECTNPKCPGHKVNVSLVSALQYPGGRKWWRAWAVENVDAPSDCPAAYDVREWGSGQLPPVAVLSSHHQVLPTTCCPATIAALTEMADTKCRKGYEQASGGVGVPFNLTANAAVFVLKRIKPNLFMRNTTPEAQRQRTFVPIPHLCDPYTSPSQWFGDLVNALAPEQLRIMTTDELIKHRMDMQTAIREAGEIVDHVTATVELARTVATVAEATMVELLSDKESAS